jgi:hypothetical protein
MFGMPIIPQKRGETQHVHTDTSAAISGCGVLQACGHLLHANGTRKNVFGGARALAYNERPAMRRDPYDAGQLM